jgi:hypothetical protein
VHRVIDAAIGQRQCLRIAVNLAAYLLIDPPQGFQ